MESLQGTFCNHPETADLDTISNNGVLTEQSIAGPSSSDNVHFEFVEGATDSRARRHAMKMYWRQKKRARQRQEENKSEKSRATRPLLPAENSKIQDRPFQREVTAQKATFDDCEAVSHAKREKSLVGLSDQLLAGIQFPFSEPLSQKANISPLRITAEHRRLFFHWLAMHAEEIHCGIESQRFSPFREIWMPLDLSNIASFNGILAHAAADLSQILHKNFCPETLKYRTEAIELINRWVGDTSTASKDEVFAAILRLFTFERYWGTPERAIFHKNGLIHMVEAKGGYKSLETNWRLQLALSLIYLTPESVSWGFPAEGIDNFFYNALGLSYSSHQTQNRVLKYDCLRTLPALKEAISLLRQNRLDQRPVDESTFWKHGEGTGTLPSVLYICVAIVKGRHEKHQNHVTAELTCLKSLECLLLDSHCTWVNSEESLSDLVWNQFAQREQNIQLTNQIGSIIASLSGIAPPTLRGLELCLLEYLLK